jgi:hypothetical protein
VFDPETQAFLESGCALIVGTVGTDGAPHAGRGWGLEVVDSGEEPQLRLLLDVEDELSIAHVAESGVVAVTATSVLTLRSIQMKGRAHGPEDATPHDQDLARQYVERFFADAHTVDQTPWSRFESFLPAGYVACTVQVHERFDQTPGPGAGARIEGDP